VRDGRAAARARKKASAGLRPGVDGTGVWIPGKIGAPGAIGAARGTRASANTSGPDFTWGLEARSGLEAGEIADRKDPHRTKKTCFFCRTDLREERTLFENAIQPFDLMSRRHPLSSIEPSD